MLSDHARLGTAARPTSAMCPKATVTSVRSSDCQSSNASSLALGFSRLRSVPRVLLLDSCHRTSAPSFKDSYIGNRLVNPSRTHLPGRPGGSPSSSHFPVALFFANTVTFRKATSRSFAFRIMVFSQYRHLLRLVGRQSSFHSNRWTYDAIQQP